MSTKLAYKVNQFFADNAINFRATFHSGSDPFIALYNRDNDMLIGELRPENGNSHLVMYVFDKFGIFVGNEYKGVATSNETLYNLLKTQFGS